MSDTYAIYYQEKQIAKFGWTRGKEVKRSDLKRGDFVFVNGNFDNGIWVYNPTFLTPCIILESDPNSAVTAYFDDGGEIKENNTCRRTVPLGMDIPISYAVPFGQTASNAYLRLANSMTLYTLVMHSYIMSKDYRVSWVYSILRDYCPAGDVEELVREVCQRPDAYEAFERAVLLVYPESLTGLEKDRSADKFLFTNGFLADYAKNIVHRLTTTRSK